ncbi:BrnA antitoxin family protein [Tabrizicola thermarum]|uniref:BrnA antitoxin family protein n=1 Tax=Tabrizicola thermarum TaxID=2670345 RepID=UPI000FFBF2C8|nr:BrnA antitoxin family protein [Tabrizicola thermarum]
MVEEGPKRLSIAEKRALNGPLMLGSDEQVAKTNGEALSAGTWTDAVLPEPSRKKLISLRVDPEVIEFFKAQGPGYQTRMNAVLQAYMQVKKEMGQR